MVKKSENEVAIFDVCDTLFYSNTTHDFIGFAIKSFSTPKHLIYKFFNHRKSPARYALIALSLATKLDLHKKLNVRLLRGKKRAALKEAAKKFVAEFLSRRRIEVTHTLLEDLCRKNFCIVLCSSSVEPVVEAVAESLGIENFVCTKLEFDGDVFTGKILEEISDEKIAALKKNELNVPFSYAISDNRGDAPLLELSKKGVAIVHSDKGYNFWKRHTVEIIDLR